MLIRSLLPGLLALALFACPQKTEPQQDPNVVVTVNGEPVPREAFVQELAREAQAMEGDGPRSPEQIEPYKQALLDTVIERTMLLQVAREKNVGVTAEEVDRRMLALASEYPAGTFDEALARSQTTRSELERRTRVQLTIEKLFEKEVFARTAVTEEQIRQYYDAHPDDFQTGEQVHAAQIVVKGLDEARRIQQQLWQGKKFGDLARRYSLSPDARVGGDLGFFSRGQMPPAFDEVVFRLNVGQVSDVVSSEYGFHLFKVLEKKPAEKKELPDVRAEIEQLLLKTLRSQKQREWVDALRAKADVKVNDQVLQALAVRPLGAPVQAP